MNRARSIDDLRAMARRRLPNFCFEYIEGGAEDEATLRRNRNVFDEIAFLLRTLVNVQHRNQSSTLLGQRTASPFMIGPTGYSGLMFGEGDVQLASTAAAGMPFVLSNASTVALEDVVQRGVRKRDWNLRNYIKPLMLDWRNKFDVLGHPRWIAAIFAGGC